MDTQEYEVLYNVEDTHWWYVGMRRLSTTLLERFYPGRTDLRILDAGCGTGGAMVYLARFGEVTGIDLSPYALAFSRQRNQSQLGQATVTRLPFADGLFDLITSFDVLYHRAVGDYRHALAEFWRTLSLGGRIFLRLPAYNWLRRHHDQAVHTVHRFTASELRAALPAMGFTVEKLSYANTLLFPLVLGKRLTEAILPPRGGSDVYPNPPWQDRLLAPFLFAEARWLRSRALPFGLTVIAIGRKTNA